MPKDSCATCQPVVCCKGSNLFFYNLQTTPVLTNPETGFLFDCPPGFNCDPGVYPLPVTIPAGTVTLTIPFPITDPGPFPPLTLNCQAGGTIQRSIPPGSTPAQILAIAASMVSECAKAIGQAKATPRRQPFRSSSACLQPCAATASFKVNGALPNGFFVAGTSFCVQSGIFASYASQADADAQAQAGLQNIFNGLRTNGTIQCGWFNAALDFHCPSSIQVVHVPAGQFFSDQATGGSQADADNQAAAFALTQCSSNIFDALVWDNPPDSVTGTGHQNTFVGGHVLFSATGNFDNGISNSNTNSLLHYAGPNRSCNAHVVVLDPGGVGNNQIFVLQDGILKLSAIPGVGTFDFPFTLAATVSSNIQVIVSIDGHFGLPVYSLEITLT